MPKQGGGEVAVRAVDEHAWTEKDIPVNGVVEVLGDVVIAGGEVVRPRAFGEALRGLLLDLVKIEQRGKRWSMVLICRSRSDGGRSLC